MDIHDDSLENSLGHPDIAVVFITKRWSDDLDALMPGWPEAGGLITLGLDALIVSLWINHLGFSRKWWLIGWGISVPTFLVLAWITITVHPTEAD